MSATTNTNFVAPLGTLISECNSTEPLTLNISTNSTATTHTAKVEFSGWLR
jgi:hypothetical protein